jgi:hypothetical protein
MTCILLMWNEMIEEEGSWASQVFLVMTMDSGCESGER